MVRTFGPEFGDVFSFTNRPAFATPWTSHLYNDVLFCLSVLVAFQIGMSIFIVWACHSSTDDLVKHTATGRMQVVLIPADNSIMTPVMTTTTAIIGATTPSPTSTLVASK